MKPKTRIIITLLAVLTALACAPFASAADGGAAVTVQKGATKRFELYRMSKRDPAVKDMSFLYSDFSSVNSGDENIAKIVDQYGVFYVVGKAQGVTTYEATTKSGEVFTGVITVFDAAPVVIGDAGSVSGDNWIAAGGGRYKYRVDYYIYDYPNKYAGDPIYHEDNPDYYINNADYYTTGDGDVYYIGGSELDNYGRIRIQYGIGANQDISFDVSGDIRLDDDGYFYKLGDAASTKPGSAAKVWGGTITLTSPTMGTVTVNVYLS